jgi:hypothetical protein
MLGDLRRPQGSNCGICPRQRAIVAGVTSGTPSFRCPLCGTASPNPGDIANGYCARCHAFTGDLPAMPADVRTWTTVSKAGWHAGPWHDEPDRVQWTDPLSGLPCLITRSPDLGCLLGYVAVPPGDPLHGADTDQVTTRIRGQITFTGPAAGIGTLDPPDIPPCDLDDPWWVGFGAFHAWDVCPGDTLMWDLLGVADCGTLTLPGHARPIAEYRPVSYMQAGCRLLAMQLAGLLVLSPLLAGNDD